MKITVERIDFVSCVKSFGERLFLSCWHFVSQQIMFKENLNASKPSEQLPSGGKMSRHLDGNIGCRGKNPSWCQKGCPM